MNFKSVFKTMAMAALCLSTVTFVSCSDDDDSKNMTFSASTVEVGIAASQDVTVKNCTTPLTAKSSDEKIATVTATKETLTITGVGTGTATILVTDANKQTGSISVTVKEMLTFDNTSVSVAADKESTVNVKSGTAPYTVAVADSKIATATVTDAAITVKGVAAGSTTITVTDSKNVTGVISVTVTK